jgi:hypothetical protein
MKQTLESEVVKAIKNNLSMYCPEVIHIDRLQSGTIQKGMRFIHLCKAGTPDLYAIVSNARTAGVLFIEAKRPGGGTQSHDQKVFEYKVKGLTNIHYIVARSIGEVINYINKVMLKKEGLS